MWYMHKQHQAVKMETESFFLKSAKITIAISAYWITSISMVFLNKQLLKSDFLQLNAPFFVTFFQCLVSVGFCIFLSFLNKVIKIDGFPSLRFDYKLSREVLPLSICFVFMIIFNNLALRDLGVAFYNIGRSLTTVFNIVLSYFVLKKSTPCLALLSCGVIMLGYLMGVTSENELVGITFSGLLYGILSSLFVSLNAIYTARILPNLEDNLWKLGYYNNINSCLILFFIVVFSKDFYALSLCPNLFSPYLWFVFIIVGIFGFMTGFTSSWQIKVTTPLTHNISGTAKACFQTVLAVVYFETPKTALWWLSNILVVVGSFFYTVVRRNVMKNEHIEKLNYSHGMKSKLKSQVV